MVLKEKERAAIKDLQTQEKSCVEKYGKYAQQAKDPELKSLFQRLQKEEQKHYDSLGMVLDLPVTVMTAMEKTISQKQHTRR